MLNNIKKTAKKIINKSGFRLLKEDSIRKSEVETKFKTELIDLYTNVKYTMDANPVAECVIFSMDRAFQLHALLSSYFEMMQDPSPLHILYRSTTDDHENAYQEVFAMFKDKDITLVKQIGKSTFKPQLLEILNNIKSSKVFFLVDDIVFKDKVDIKDLAKFDFKNFVPSLKMGDHLTKCGVAQDKPQPLPEFKDGVVVDADKLCWIWNEGVLDWDYPLSVDGHIFLVKEILIFINLIEFATPNTLEGLLNLYLQYFHNRYGVSYKTSKIINLPLNRVTTEAEENYFGNIDTTFLLEKWQQGYQMDYKKLYGYKNQDVHEDIQIDFIKRK